MESNKEQRSISDRLAYRFTLKEKLEAVRLVETGERKNVVMGRYQISDKTLTSWLKRFSSTYQPLSFKVYKPSEKRSVLRAIEQGMSVSHAAIVFGIRNSGSIREWMKKSKSENAELSGIDMKKQEKAFQQDQDVKALKQQLAEAQIKIKALETMIDVAEEHLKIDIRKKSGAKQSAK